jgi:hypothetical protein
VQLPLKLKKKKDLWLRYKANCQKSIMQAPRNNLPNKSFEEISPNTITVHLLQ